MGWLDFLCAPLIRQVESLRAENEKLRGGVSTLSKNYISCLSDKSQIILNCNKDKQYLSLRVVELSQMLAQSVTFPLLPLTDVYLTIEPDSLEELYEYDMVRADLIYYAFPKDTWVWVLEQVQPIVKKCLKSWVKNASDCDDWALVMNAFLAVVFKNAGLKYQGAFTIAWSNSHAYNLYVDEEKKIWVYEPQTGETLGLLCDGEKPYDTRKIWFIGERI